MLFSTAGLVVGQVALSALAGKAGSVAKTPPGKLGEFDFLAGSWKIQQRRLKNAGTDDWDEFPGEAACWRVLAGAGSIEELRSPARDFSGLGIRLLDRTHNVWTDFWVNAKSCVLTTLGLTGSFVEGVETFEADDVDGDQPIEVRGVWHRITKSSCRWHQAMSRDGRKTWQPHGFMDCHRVSLCWQLCCGRSGTPFGRCDGSDFDLYPPSARGSNDRADWEEAWTRSFSAS
jgi:hypothetical protein